MKEWSEGTANGDETGGQIGVNVTVVDKLTTEQINIFRTRLPGISIENTL